MNNIKFCALDVETTGLDPEKDRVVELAAVHVTWFASGQHRIGPYWSWLVNPGIPIPPEASAIHHLTDRDVAKAPTIEQVLNGTAPTYTATDDGRGEPLIHDGIVPVAHNAAFDSAFVAPDRPWLCTRRLAMHLWPDAPRHSNQVLRYWLGLDPDEARGKPAHRALADAIVTAHLLVTALRRYTEVTGWVPESGAELIEFAERPVTLKTIRFGKHAGSAWSELSLDYLRWMARQNDWDRDVQHTLETELQRRRTTS